MPMACWASRLRVFTVNYALVEEAVNIASEYYLGITIDRDAEKAIIMLSSMGGIDIEEVAATQPGRSPDARRSVVGTLGLPVA